MTRRGAPTLVFAIAIACVAMSSGSCTLALTYPEGSQERSALECADGRDNDLDGRTDCDDADCNGHCPEDALELCADGIDQDGDGKTDFADPSCWPYARVEVQSCASSPGGDVDLDFDGADETWATVGAPLAVDPSGEFGDESFVLPTDVRTASATYDARLAGAVHGLHAEADVHLDPATAQVRIALVVDDAPTDYYRLEAEIGAGLVEASSYWTPRDAYPAMTDWGGAADTYHLDVSATADDRLVVTVSQAGLTVATTSCELVPTDRVPGWGRPIAIAHRFGIRIEASHTVGSAPAVVGRVALHMERVDPCGIESPPPTSLGAAMGATITSGARHGNVTCLFGTDSANGAVVWLVRSDDEGRSWTATDVPFTPTTAFPRSYGITSRPNGFELTLAREPYTFGTSRDCTDVTDVVDGPLPIIDFVHESGRPIGYAFDGTVRQFVWLTGPDGSPHHFRLERVPADGSAHSTFDLGDVPAAIGEVRGAIVGNDVVLTWQRGMASVALPPRRESTARPFATLGPSGLVGACDEAQIETPVFILDETPVLDEPGVVATGTLYFACDPSVPRITSQRVVVRAP